VLGGEATVYRGHEGVREFGREIDSAFAELHAEISEIRDLGDRLVASGHLRASGIESGARIESPYGAVAEFKNGKVVRYRDYLDPKKALEAVGLRE